MKGATLVRKGDALKAFEIREHKEPVLREIDVLIEVEAFGLNFADVMARNGLYKAAPPMPSLLGYDVVGKVVKSGSDQGSYLIGKRVVAMTRFGGYAELAATDHRACAVIPEDMDPAKAAALATQYCTAYHAAYECVSLFEGDKVLIHAAAGGVGTALTQLAKLKGCEVFGITSSDKKVDYLKSNGVDHPIVLSKGDYVDQIRAIAGNDIMVAFNSVGGKTFGKDRSLLAKGGRSVLYGAAERSGKKGGALATMKLALNFGFMSPIPFIVNSQGVIGINMLMIADHQPLIIKRNLEAVVEMTKNGDLDPQVGGIYPVDQIGEAHAFLESRKSTGKIVVKW